MIIRRLAQIAHPAYALQIGGGGLAVLQGLQRGIDAQGALMGLKRHVVLLLKPAADALRDDVLLFELPSARYSGKAKRPACCRPFG